MLLRTVFLAAMFCGFSLPIIAAENSDLTRVRALGAELAKVRNRVEYGSPPSAAELGRLQQAFDKLAAAVDGDSAAIMKLRSVGRGLTLLKHLAENPKQRAAGGIRNVSEVVTHSHGASCLNAMGLTTDRPSRVTLSTGADAWFYASTRALIALRISTQSNGADPALEVFANCSPTARQVVENDDSLGLDAAVTVPAGNDDIIFVHLTNSGEPGTIEVSTAAAVGTITGTVRDGVTGQVVGNAYVEAFTSTSSGADYVGVYADFNGNYTLGPSTAGNYYVAADATSYIAQVYATGSCGYSPYQYFDFTTCDVSHATTVAVSDSKSATNINFSLGKGVHLSGQVRASSNVPLSAAYVSLIGSNGSGITSAYTDAAGHYTFATLPPGMYFVQSTQTGYVSQLWNHINCAAQAYQICDTTAATAISVATVDVADINFSLQHVSTIQGVVSALNGPLLLPYAQAYVNVLDQSGNEVIGGSIDSSGHYTVSPVPIGTYYVFATVPFYFDQLYAGHDCLGSCVNELASGTVVKISANEEQIEADFVLKPFPTVSGRVTEASTGTPLPGTTIVVTTTPNTPYSPATTTTTDASGNYLFNSVGPGSYYVWAQSPDHIDEIFDGVPCENSDLYYQSLHCDLSGATLLTISYAGAMPAVIDFALSPSASIAGRVIERAGPGSDLPALGALVTIYDGTGAAIADAPIDAMGNYSITDLAAGTYYALAASSYFYTPFTSQLWQNEDCNTCVPTTGTPIQLAQGTATEGIDFQLTAPDSVVGRVVDESGQPIQGAVVDLFNTFDKSYAAGAPADQQGYFAVHGNINNSYYVATEAGGGYIDQVYSGIACPLGTAYDGRCSLNGASAITLLSGATQPHVVDFVLKIGDRVFGNGFE